jgi:GTP-binding protein EngB required for normal cell division
MPTNTDPESEPLNSSEIKAGFGTNSLLPSNIDFQSLQHYTETKLIIANQLRSLLDLLKKRGDETRIQQCEQLMGKLAEDRFTIAVLGQFKRGKSSLLNAIIGRDLLPTGILPLTSVITAVRFGARERLVIYRKGLQFPVCDSIATLAEYVTEKENPANRRGVEMVVIELPLPFLRRGLEFVDTPGIGSAIKANTETTYSFLPKCDAVLFVTGVDSPLSEAELDLLFSIRRFAGKIFFILNKMDLLSDENDVAQVSEFVKSRLVGEMGLPEISLIAVSAIQALEANAKNNPAQFAGSGLLQLQERLAQFLATERQGLFLGTVIAKANQLTRSELRETEVGEKVKEVSATELRRYLNEVKAKTELVRAERRQIFGNIRGRVSQLLCGAVAEELAIYLSEVGDAAVRRLDRYLAVAPLWPTGRLNRRYTQAIGRLFWTRTCTWIARNSQRLVNDFNAVAKDDFAGLRSNLAGLATLPHKAVGIGIAEDPNRLEELDSLKLEPHFELQLGQNMQWNPSVPLMVRFLPGALARPWFRNYLCAQLSDLIGRREVAIIGVMQRAVDEQVEILSRRFSAYAAKLERRASDILSQKSQKQTDQGDRLSDGETAVLYRHGLQSLDANFSALRKHVQADLRAIEEVALTSVRPISSPNFKRRVSQLSKPGGRKSYVSRGCPVCDHLVDVSKEFFAAFQYSLYNDDQQQQSFAQNGGFCPFHLWQLESISSAVGFSVGVARLVKHVAQLLGQTSSGKSANEILQQIKPQPEQCPACGLLRQSEREFVARFLGSLSEAETKRRYIQSTGVCLHHLEMAIAVSPDEETTRFLLQTASTGFQLMAEDMEGFALKREASRRHMVSEDEEDAHLRAAIHLAGAKHNCMSWTFNDEI